MEQQRLDGTTAPETKPEAELPDSEPVAPKKHIRLVEAETGEFLNDHVCTGCQAREAEIKKLTTEGRSWHRKFLIATTNRDQEARDHQLWSKALTLFAEYRIATDRPKVGWDAERFWLCQPYLEADGFPTCRWGVWGIAYEPNRKQLPSGLWEVYNDWELLFRNRGTFERYVRRGFMNPEARAQFDLREQGIDLKWLEQAKKDAE
jgi:hypothetical protein